MKRYSTTSIRAYAPAEDPNGEWVKYADASAEIEQLKAELAELQYLLAKVIREAYEFANEKRADR